MKLALLLGALATLFLAALALGDQSLPPGQVLAALLGLVGFVGLAWLASLNRRQFPWRTVLSGVALQFGFAFLILRTDFGRVVFDFTQRGFNRLLGFATEGARMVFGPLADGALLADRFGPSNASIFAVGVPATIIVVAAETTSAS